MLLYRSYLVYCGHELFNTVHCVTALPLEDIAVKSSTRIINSSSCSLAILSSPIKSYQTMNPFTNPTAINWIQPHLSTNLQWNNFHSYPPSAFTPPLPRHIPRATLRPPPMRIKSYLLCMPCPIKRRTNKNAWIVCEKRMGRHAMLLVSRVWMIHILVSGIVLIIVVNYAK